VKGAQLIDPDETIGWISRTTKTSFKTAGSTTQLMTLSVEPNGKWPNANLDTTEWNHLVEKIADRRGVEIVEL